MFFFKYFSTALLLISASAIIHAQSYMAGGREHLPPKPAQVAGVSHPIKSLDGNWEINITPSSNSTSDNKPSAQWKPILVPGEAQMQGFKIKHDDAFVYRKKLNIINPGKGLKHLIRFNGVFNHAKVYINGELVREHFGGFTAWDADITPHLKTGQDNWLHVWIEDRADDISYASGYAAHPIGGITRKVDYIILPEAPVKYLYTQAGLTNSFKDGTLKLEAALPAGIGISYAYSIADAKGHKILTKNFDAGKLTGNILKDSFSIPNIQPWTAESPNLYTLSFSILKDKKPIQTIKEPIGFRSLEINSDNEMLVNGKTVKLRGACRHDMHPTLGRSTNRAQDSLDAVLTKESNMNFIRTSHYPPSEDFLEFCDKLGIYVQEETAICFVLDWRVQPYFKYYKTMDDPAFTDRYLGQLSEMIDRDRNHASVIMWSIGNESTYGSNFQKEYEFVKQAEPTRPVSWSFPTTALNQGKRCFDILVSHYPKYNGYPNTNGQTSDLGKYEKNMKGDYPIIGDEWAHVNCYNTDLSIYEPNAKDFWGKSLDSMWMYRFDVKGYLGGAIWGMIDETFQLPDTTVGYGPWGIVDVWRRKKAEFWNTKKAYSPIRLDVNHFDLNNGNLSIPAHNRFDHTNLKSVIATIVINGKKTAIAMPDIAPHEKGSITIPISGSRDSAVLIQFSNASGNLIDEELISWKAKPTAPSINSTGSWAVSEKNGITFLKNGNIAFEIDSKTGSLMFGKVNDKNIITGNASVVLNRPLNAGVLKNTDGLFTGIYKIQNHSFDAADKNVFIIHTKGAIDSFPVSIKTSLYPNGEIKIEYTADNIPAYTWDIGVEIPVVEDLNTIHWSRKGYWTTYPKDHLAPTSGSATKLSGGITPHRAKPAHPAAQDRQAYKLTKNTDALNYVTLPASDIYRAKKENIHTYTLSGKTGGISVLSDGSQAAKMNVDKSGGQQLQVSDKWDYWTISWGNYQGIRNSSKKMSGTILLQISER